MPPRTLMTGEGTLYIVSHYMVYGAPTLLFIPKPLIEN